MGHDHLPAGGDVGAQRGLKQVYALLKVDGDFSVMEHLFVDRVDFCTFGNSMPFRVRIVNAYNDNQDYFYVKQADASRVYGLELEHLLSPNRLNFLTSGATLIEEHIPGIPGDVFIRRWLKRPDLRPIRVAKELVKFNERCFVRLLGDMRSYNFVFVVTPDFEDAQLRIRAMDFDQQSYDGRKNFYLPQFFKENAALAMFCVKHLRVETAHQYQREEQTLMLRRAELAAERLGPAPLRDVPRSDRARRKRCASCGSPWPSTTSADRIPALRLDGRPRPREPRVRPPPPGPRRDSPDRAGVNGGGAPHSRALPMPRVAALMLAPPMQPAPFFSARGPDRPVPRRRLPNRLHCPAAAQVHDRARPHAGGPVGPEHPAPSTRPCRIVLPAPPQGPEYRWEILGNNNRVLQQTRELAPIPGSPSGQFIRDLPGHLSRPQHRSASPPSSRARPNPTPEDLYQIAVGVKVE